jgi:outer membrane protein TolC
MLLSNKLSAQSKTFTLLDFIDSSQHYFPLLLQKQALVNSARSQVTEAKHAFLPQAIAADQVTLGSDNSLPGSYLSLGVIPSTSSGIRSENNYQSAVGNIAIINSEYELVNFGLKGAKVKSAESYVNLSEADLSKEQYLLKWQVCKLYFDIVKNEYQKGIEAENVKRYSDIYTVIHAITASGIKAGVDSSLAMAELAKANINYNEIDGNILRLKQQLSYLTGIDAFNINMDTSSTKNVLNSLQTITDTSTALNPMIDYYNKQKMLYQSTEELVKKSYLPKILLTGTVWARGSSIDYEGNYKALGEGLAYERFNYMAGVTFAYDLFNSQHKKDKLTTAHYQTIASDYAAQQQQLSLQNVKNQASTVVNTAYKNLEQIPVQIRAAKDAFAQKTAQYKAGIINLVDLTNASFVLYRSQTDYVQTLSNWLLGNLDQAAANGNLDLFIQTVNK